MCIWRINALGLLVVIGILVVSFLEDYDYLFPFGNKADDRTSIILNVAEDDTGENHWKLGVTIPIAGTHYLMVPLISSDNELELGFSGFEAAAQGGSGWLRTLCRNIMFINEQTNESVWLFDSNKQLIADYQPIRSHYMLTEKHSNDSPNAIIYKTITSDTNNDNMINMEDSQSLAISKPDGTGLKTLVDRCDRMVSQSGTSDGALLIIYQSRGIGYSMLLNLESFEIISNNELPKTS